MTDRNKPGGAFWTTVVVTGLVLYGLSTGPAVWLRERDLLSDSAIEIAYWPIVHAPPSIYDVFDWYATLWQ